MAELQSTEDLRKGLQQATDEAKNLLGVTEKMLVTIEATAKVLKKDISVDFGDASELAKINKLVEDSNKLAKEREKTDKQRKTTKKKLQDLTDEELKLRIKEQKAFRDRKKSVENELALEKKSIKSRENLLAANKALRAEVDKLDVTTQVDEINALNEQIDENTKLINKNVDSERKRVSAIGKYTEGVKEALSSTSLFGDEAKKLQGVLNALTKLWDKNEDAAEGAADATEEVGESAKKTNKAVNILKGGMAVLIAVFSAIGSAFASTRSGGLELRTTFAGIQAGFKVFVASLARAGGGVFTFIKSLGSSFSILGTKTALWASETKLSVLEVLNVFGDYDKAISNTKNEIADLTKEQSDLQKEIDKGNEGLEEAGNAFDGFGKRVEEVKQALIDFENQQDALIDAQSKLLISIAKLRGEEELNKALEGENAAAIKDRIKAIEQAVKANDKRTKQEVKLAEKQLKLVNLEIKAARAASGLGDAYKITKELTDKYTDAVVNLTDAESERATSAIDNRALLTQLALDVLELELDVLLDGFDNQKTINERKLANDRVTLDKKKLILEELLSSEKEFIEKSNEAFNKDLKELGFSQNYIDLVKETVDLTSLVNTLQKDGASALNKQLQALIADEKVRERILEFVKEINTFQQDNLENTQAIKDETKEIAELEAEIADQKRRLAGEDEEESKEKLIQDKIDILERELELEEKGSRKSLEIEKELNNLKLEQQENRLKKEEENSKKSAKKQEELIRETVKLAEKLLDNLFDKENDQIEDQLEANLNSQEQLQKAKDAGSKEAIKSLAILEKEQRELEARQEKLEKRRMQAEAFIAGVQLLAKNNGDLGATVGDIAGLSSFISTLPGFFDGVDDTGNGNGLKDKHGNITGFTHDNEQVWSQADRAEVGNRSRQEIKDIVSMADRGSMVVNKEGSLVVASQNNTELLNEMKGFRKDLSKLKLESNLFIDPQYFREEFKGGKRKDTQKRKSNTWR